MESSEPQIPHNEIFDLPPLQDYIQPKAVLYIISFWFIGHYTQLNVIWIWIIFFIVNQRIICSSFKSVLYEIMGYHPCDKINQSLKMNPETETPLFINKFISVFWDTCLRPILRKDIKDFINNKLAAFPNRIVTKYIHPRLIDLDIDFQPPYITGIKYYDPSLKECPSLNDCLLIDAGVRLKLVMDARCRILRKEWAQFGIKFFQIDSQFRLRISPLLRVFDKDETINSLGDTEVSLLSPIELDYEFIGLLKFLNNFLLKSLLGHILSFISSFIFYPRYMGFKKPKSSIGKSKSLRPCHYMGPVATSLTPSVPKCLMRVEILEGRDLARFKLPLICICPPKTDPFITLSVTELRPYLITPPIKGTTNPKFNYLTEIPLLERDIKFRELRIGVMDAFTNCSALKGSGSLGFTTIDIKKAYESKGPHCSWYQLGEGKGGQIKIVLHFFPINDGRFNLPMFAISEDRRINQAVFILVIHRVFTTQKCRPIISIKVTGRPTERTSAGHFCNVYEFSEEFIFPIYYVGTDKVCIRVENEYGNSKAIKTASKKICGFMRRILTNVNLDREDDLHRHQDEDLSNFHMKIAESTYPITFFNGNNQVLKMHSFDGHSVKLSIIGKIYFVKSC